MTIEYLHASKFGNGERVAGEFAERMAARGVTVNVRHVKRAKPAALPAADLYVFSSPGRMGRPIRSVRRFLGRVALPAGTHYALLTTEMAPRPDPKTGRVPTEEESAKTQRVRPIMNEILQAKGLVPIAEDRVFVTDIEGPLEEGWEEKVAAFAAGLPIPE
jgi:hypothetical protein